MIRFDINADSEAVFDPTTRDWLKRHGVMGMDWLRDIQFEAKKLSEEMRAEVFPR